MMMRTAAPLRAVHVAWMAGAFCAGLFALNGYFLVAAIRSFPGEVAPKSYLQGLEYNATLARRAAQRELGWSMQAGLQDGRIVVRVLDREGQPEPGLVVTAGVHVVGDADAIVIALQADPASGDHVATYPARSGHRIELAIEARRPESEDIVFEAAKTLVAP
jgi:nitrogen fixation protein FixH